AGGAAQRRLDGGRRQPAADAPGRQRHRRRVLAVASGAGSAFIEPGGAVSVADEPDSRSAPRAEPTPPRLPAELVPRHVALVMDGNGRWAAHRGRPRTKGHEAGEAVLMDVIAGAIQIGIKYLSVYAFSTENWRRTPEEVR